MLYARLLQSWNELLKDFAFSNCALIVFWAMNLSVSCPAPGQETHANPQPTDANPLASTPVCEPAAAKWRQKPIPHRQTGSALTYHQIPVDLTHPRAKERLVDLGGYGIASEAFYARADKLNAPYFRPIEGASSTVRCRETVARMLRQTNEKLAPLGIELFVLDGWRSIECQRALWNFFMQQAKVKLPGAAQSELVQYAGKYCSDPSRFKPTDSRTWTTHVTGGAVDVTLRRRHTGELLYMGGIFDDPSELSSASYYETGVAPRVVRSGKTLVQTGNGLTTAEHSPTTADDTLSAQQARANRRLLYWAMTEAGFANYPPEWWHFDFGDQMWVQNTKGATKAWYGPAVQRD